MSRTNLAFCLLSFLLGFQHLAYGQQPRKAKPEKIADQSTVRSMEVTILESLYIMPNECNKDYQLSTRCKNLLKESALSGFKIVEQVGTVEKEGIVPKVIKLASENGKKEAMIYRMKETQVKCSSAGLAIAMGENWFSPFVIIGNRLPSIEFRHGQIGLHNGDIFIKEGTEARITEEEKSEKKAYKFLHGRWLER